MGRGRWGLGLAGALIAVACAGACRQTLGLDAYANGSPDDSGSGASSGLDGSACGLAYGTATCAACAASHCCDESTACAGDLECSNCVGACGGDAGCEGACVARSFVASSTSAALGACLARSCRGECDLSCGAMAAYLSPPAQASACETCLGPNACNPEGACAASDDCQGYARCLHSCFTPDCREHCAVLHDAGAQLFAPLAATAAATKGCAAACGYGQDWTCLGHVGWPAANAATTDVRFVVNDFATYAPVAGASVSVCSQVSQVAACTSTLASGKTDANGSLDLSVTTETATIPPAGLQPQILLSAPGYSLTYLDLPFPLSEPVFTFPPSLSDLFATSYFGLTPGEPPAGMPDDAGPPIVVLDAGSADAGGPAYAQLVVYVVDCQGNPADGVSVSATPELLLCGPGVPPALPSCSSQSYEGTTGSLTLPGIVSLRVLSGQYALTVSVQAPPPPSTDGGPMGLPCCTPGLLTGPGVFTGGPPAGDASDEALSAGPAGDAGGPAVTGPSPTLSLNDAGIPCAPVADGGCSPVCSTDPGCVPSSPSLLDGGQIVSLAIDVPDWTATGVWALPQPRP